MASRSGSRTWCWSRRVRRQADAVVGAFALFFEFFVVVAVGALGPGGAGDAVFLRGEDFFPFFGGFHDGGYGGFFGFGCWFFVVGRVGEHGGGKGGGSSGDGNETGFHVGNVV